MSRIDEVSADLGSAGWNDLLPARSPNPSLELDIDTDYLIVGAGFAGLSAARRIRQLDADANIVILEAFEIATGPAGRNSGFMIDLPHALAGSNYAGGAANDNSREIKLNRAAIAFVKQVVDEYEMPDEAFNACGKTSASAGSAGILANQKYARHLESIGEPYELLDAAAMRRICGSNYYAGGLKTPGTVLIQPAIYIRHFSEGLAEIDACRLFEHSPVVELFKQASRWTAKTPRGSVQAHKVILAVNGLVETFGFFKRRLMQVNLYASMTRALTAFEIERLAGEQNWGFTPANHLGSTVRRFRGTGGDRLLIRNRCTYEPNFKLPANRLKQIAIDHDHAFKARFPMLGGVDMAYRWSGRLCLSRNDVWAIAEVAENLHTACCQNGLGTTKGTIAGIIAAEAACNKTSDTVMPDYLSQALPRNLLPEPLMTLGARSYLKFGEWKAGREL